MKSDNTNTHEEAVIDRIIAMAWADRVPFESIEAKVGLTEAEVIKVMRRNLKPKSFRIWRQRVSGRGTKHRKRFQHRRSDQPDNDINW